MLPPAMPEPSISVSLDTAQTEDALGASSDSRALEGEEDGGNHAWRKESSGMSESARARASVACWQPQLKIISVYIINLCQTNPTLRRK